MLINKKYKGGQSKTAQFCMLFYILTVQEQNFSQNSYALSEENVNISELYVRHFPREFANSLVNTTSGGCNLCINIDMQVHAYSYL